MTSWLEDSFWLHLLYCLNCFLVIFYLDIKFNSLLEISTSEFEKFSLTLFLKASILLDRVGSLTTNLNITEFSSLKMFFSNSVLLQNSNSNGYKIFKIGDTKSPHVSKGNAQFLQCNLYNFCLMRTSDKHCSI